MHSPYHSQRCYGVYIMYILVLWHLSFSIHLGEFSRTQQRYLYLMVAHRNVFIPNSTFFWGSVSLRTGFSLFRSTSDLMESIINHYVERKAYLREYSRQCEGKSGKYRASSWEWWRISSCCETSNVGTEWDNILVCLWYVEFLE